MKRTGMLLLLGLLAAPAWADDAAAKVMECMRANVPPQLSIGMLELTVYDRTGGSRQLKGRMFPRKEQGGARGLRHASLRIDAPAEFKGAAWATRGAGKARHSWAPASSIATSASCASSMPRLNASSDSARSC